MGLKRGAAGTKDANGVAVRPVVKDALQDVDIAVSGDGRQAYFFGACL